MAPWGPRQGPHDSPHRSSPLPELSQTLTSQDGVLLDALLLGWDCLPRGRDPTLQLIPGTLS